MKSCRCWLLQPTLETVYRPWVVTLFSPVRSFVIVKSVCRKSFVRFAICARFKNGSGRCGGLPAHSPESISGMGVGAVRVPGRGHQRDPPPPPAPSHQKIPPRCIRKDFDHGRPSSCICQWESAISLFCLLGTPTLFSTLFRRLFAFGFLAAFGF